MLRRNSWPAWAPCGSGPGKEPGDPRGGRRRGEGKGEDRAGAKEERRADNDRREWNRGRPAERGLRDREGSGRARVCRVALSPGQVLQNLLLNDPGHTAASSAGEQRRPSPRRGTGTGYRSYSGRHGALSPPPRRP